MTVNRTTLLDLPLPVTGTESGVWGDVTNNGLTQYLDISIAGRTALTSANFSGGALTLSLTEGDSSATNIAATSAQYATLYVSSLAQNSTITAPSSNRAYRVVNDDSTYTLTVKAAGQTGVVFPIGTSGTVVFNGTDYVLLNTVGAASSTDNAIARFDSISGKIIQNSGVTIDDSNNLTLPGQADLRFADSDSSNWVAFQSPATVASNVTWTLPAADGTSNQALVTNGSGTLSWATASASPGGSNTQLQYNNAGAFGGISGVTSDGTRITASTTIGVGGATPSTSGSGITFPATASASSDANTLDDYEEGTFTPDVNIGGATTGITYTGRAGKYTKIGNLVYVSLGVVLSSKGALSGNITIAGLPFASANTDYREPYWRGTSNNFADFSAAVTTSATTLQVRNPTTTAAITNTTLANNSSLFVNGCYQI